MKTTNIFTIILFIFITGCKESPQENQDMTPPIEHREAVHPEQVGWEDDIELDEGNQWQVQRGTTEGIQQMSEILENDSSKSVEEYRDLGQRLQKEKSNVDSGKTSEDTSNGNLDIYLESLDKKIKSLQEVESIEEGARIKSDLEKHLYAYSNYFV